MPQLSLYLDGETMSQLREDAAQASCSLSQFVARRLQAPKSAWPVDYWSLYGALDDDSFCESPELDPTADDPIPAFD